MTKLEEIRQRFNKISDGPYNIGDDDINNVNIKDLVNNSCEFIENAWIDIDFLLKEIAKLQVDRSLQLSGTVNRLVKIKFPNNHFRIFENNKTIKIMVYSNIFEDGIGDYLFEGQEVRDEVQKYAQSILGSEYKVITVTEI